MSNPLVEERPGDLAALGLPSKNDMEPFDVTAEREEQEQAQEPAPEPEARASEEEVQAQEPEGEESEEGLLESFRADHLPVQPAEDPENTRLRQENQRLQDELKNRIAMVESRLAGGVQPEPVAVETSPLQSPVIRATLDALREEDPAKYEMALVEIATKQAEAKLAPRIDAFEQRSAEEKQNQAIQNQQTAFWQQVSATLAGIKGEGGLSAKIVEDLEGNMDSSFLGQRFKTNPGILYSKEGIRGAVREIEAELRAHAESRQSGQPGQVLDEGRVSGGGRSVSKRGLTLDEQPKTRTPEEEIADSIMGAGGGAKKALPFMG